MGFPQCIHRSIRERRNPNPKAPLSPKEPWGLSATESDHPHREPGGLGRGFLLLAKLAPCYSDLNPKSKVAAYLDVEDKMWPMPILDGEENSPSYDRGYDLQLSLHRGFF